MTGKLHAFDLIEDTCQAPRRRLLKDFVDNDVLSHETVPSLSGTKSDYGLRATDS